MKDRNLFQESSRPSVREKITNYGPSSASLEELVQYAINPSVQREDAVSEALKGIAPKEIVHYSADCRDYDLTDREARLLGVISAIVRHVLDAGPEWRGERIDSPEKAYWALGSLRFKDREEMHALLLNTKSNVLADELVSIGTLDMSVAHPREVFKRAIKAGAAGIILAHNHPSGDPTPSPEDIQLTGSLVAAGKILGIDVVDHVVIANGRWVSLREKGLM